MTRKKPTSELPASVRTQRPHLVHDANCSNNRIDELDAQNGWQHHIDAGLLKAR